MNRLVVTLTVLASAMVLGAPARADKKSPPEQPLALPKVGDTLSPNGSPSWPAKLEWLYDLPSFKDATGKIVLHWFCSPKLNGCTEDLARIVTLKENNPRVYIIAYVDAPKKGEAKKLDPIRETEGVGRGTVAFGKQTIQLIRRLGITAPVSVVVGLDNKVALVTTGASPADLDARDAKVAALASAIKDYTTSSDGPKVVKAGDKFQLSMMIKLASWLKFSKRTPAEFRLTAVPPDIKCDATTLRGAQLRIVDQTTMTAQVTCSGPRGVYELRGSINFGYDNPIGGGSGLGNEDADWKFEIKP